MVYDCAIQEGQSPYLMARLQGIAGTPVKPADVSQIDYTIGDNTGTLDPVDVIYDPLVSNDPRWTVDADGYNFGWLASWDLFDTSPSCQSFQLVTIKFTLAISPPNIVNIYYRVYVRSA